MARRDNVADRSREAEECEGLLDLIDAWVSASSTAEEVAHAIYLKLPRDIATAMREIAMRGPVPLDPPTPAHPYRTPTPRTEPDVVEAAIESTPAAPDPIATMEPLETALEREEQWDPNAYEIHILDQGFEPWPNAGWHLAFEAIDCPRLSYQTRDPVLNAYVRFDVVREPVKQLSSGRTEGRSEGGALARLTDFASKATAIMLGTDEESVVLRGAFGAAVVDTDKQADYRTFERPSDEVIVAECRKAIAKHLLLVKQERERLAVTAPMAEGIIGKRFK